MLGQRIKEARTARRLTQEKFAQQLGVSSFTVSRWERGLHKPSIDDLYRIAEHLDVTVVALLNGRETA